MNGSGRPPRLARLLLERVLPADVREHVSGDLEELFHRRCSDLSGGSPRLWYWRQVLVCSGQFAAERLRDRRRGTDVSTGLSWMDVKLAARMLIRYPGLTTIGLLGMSVGIAIAAGAFGIIYTFLDPALPFDEGERIVAVQNWDQARNNPERRILHDYLTWRAEVTSLEDLGAFRQVGRNLIAPGGQPETVRVAEMSASGFRVPRVPPFMGRHLLEEDERPGAAPVLVIGFDVWRQRFGADPDIVGRIVQLGDATRHIVGVMPEGFAFPVSDRFWVPLRLDPGRFERRQGPELTVFGRLAPGASFEAAEAELRTIGRREAAAYPATHAQLQPKVVPYTYPFFDIDDPSTAWVAHLAQLLITLLLVVVCANVAILVYARTATRHAEIAVRSALGASRRRIVGQLFLEALVLTGSAAALGLLLTSIGLKQVNAALFQLFPGTPFWWRFGISSGVVLYVVGLTVLAAAIVGVLPAVKATGRRVQAGLRTISAGGGSGMQMGRTWTILVVVQVGVAVALLPGAVFHAWESVQYGSAAPGFAAAEVLTAQLVLDPAGASGAAGNVSRQELATRYADRQADLVRRLRAEPGITAVTFSSSLPGGEPTVWIEADGIAPPALDGEEGGWVQTGTRAGHEVRFNHVAPELFTMLGVPLLTGRALAAADAGPGANSVVVNASFVRDVLGHAHPLGRRVRYVGTSNDTTPGEVELGRWYEIVGVVADFPARPTESGVSSAKLYHAAATGQVGATIAIRLRGMEPMAFAGRLREIGAAVDRDLQLRNIDSLDAALRRDQSMMRVVAAVLGALTLSVILLSSAGIYALMSFTVAQRRKEIGIRAALGADARRILGDIFSRALGQLAIGAVAGAAAAALLDAATDGELMKGNGGVVLPIVAMVMMIVGLLAALGPALRGLAIQPTEALREQ